MGQLIVKFSKRNKKPIGGCMSSPTITYETPGGSEGKSYEPKKAGETGVN